MLDILGIYVCQGNTHLWKLLVLFFLRKGLINSNSPKRGNSGLRKTGDVDRRERTYLHIHMLRSFSIHLITKLLNQEGMVSFMGQKGTLLTKKAWGLEMTVYYFRTNHIGTGRIMQRLAEM